MKVAFILPSLANVGPVVATFNLIKQLLVEHIDVEVFYFDEIMDLVFPCKVSKISFKRIHNFSKFDFVHTVGFRPDLYVFLYKSIMKSICITNIHNYIFEDMKLTYGYAKGFIYIFLSILSIFRHNVLIVTTNNMYRYYKKIFWFKNIQTIMYGIPSYDLDKINISHLQILLNLRNNFKVIGSVGVLVKRKGYSQLIDLLTKSQDYSVVIIGDGPEKANLLNYARELGVSERFFILGFQSNSYNYMPYFDIYAVTSYSEGFSLAMADAFSIGIPVVLSYIPTHFNSIPNDAVNFYIPDNIISLNSAVTDSLLRNNFFSTKSKDFYFQYLDEAKIGSRYQNLYNNLLKND